jgi:hypothetical protein
LLPEVGGRTNTDKTMLATPLAWFAVEPLQDSRFARSQPPARI